MCEKRKSFKKTNTRQFEKMVEIMEANPDVGKGFGHFGLSKQYHKQCWELVALELNLLGPPTRTRKEWHKVWLDYKLNVKKKVASMKKVSSKKKALTTIEDGPFVLSTTIGSMHQKDPNVSHTGPRNVNSAIGLTDLELVRQQQQQHEPFTEPHHQQSVNPSGGKYFGGADLECLLPDVQVQTEQYREYQQNAIINLTPSTSRCRNANESERIRLLQNQTAKQSELVTTATRIETAVTEIATYTRKIYELKRDELDLSKAKKVLKERELLEKNRRHKEKMELKLKKLELKTRKYESLL